MKENAIAVKTNLIDGKSMSAASGQLIDTFNPATGQAIAQLARSDAQDVNAAVQAARRAFEGEWSRWTPHDRQKLLLRVHDVIEKNFDELAELETMDMGAPLARTKSLKPFVLKAIHYYSTQTVNTDARPPVA